MLVGVHQIMKVNVETIETNKIKLDVEVDASEFQKAIGESYKTLVKRASIPGFRKGKAPKHILERFVGKEALYEDAFERLFPEVYSQAVIDAGIEPVDEPQVKIEQMEEGKPLQFEAEVVVKPEVVLGDYDQVAVARANAEVTADEVEKEIDRLLDRYSQLVPVEGPVENGHFATIDFEGFVDEEAFPGGKAENYPLHIGSGVFVPGFEEGVVGMQKGETRDVQATFPEEYPEESLAGKQATFVTTVKEIKVKEVPELTDDLVKSNKLGESVEELRSSIENRLLKDKEEKSKREHENQVLKAVSDMCTVEIPEVMVERKTNEMLQRLVERLQAIGVTLEDYLANTGRDMQSLHSEYKEAAAEAVKIDLVVEAVAKKEGIEATEEDIESAIANIAERYAEKPETIRATLMKEDAIGGLRIGVISDKTIAYLSQKARENAANKPEEVDAGSTESAEDEDAEETKAE